ncbi:MAG: hypothetical protein AAF449_06975, partial [Myxococcota bacterium]
TLGRPVKSVHSPRLYLKARASIDVRRALARRLTKHPDILEAFVPEDVERFSSHYRDFFMRSISAGRMPDILFRPAPYRYVSEVNAEGKGFGTGHGSPYLYDQSVPVLLNGPGIRSGLYRSPVVMTQLVPSIAAALQISPPPTARAAPLEAVR